LSISFSLRSIRSRVASKRSIISVLLKNYLSKKAQQNAASEEASSRCAKFWTNIKNSYFKEVFESNYCYLNYFDLYEELKNKSYKYSAFPCLIDNYSIINWTDNWLDPSNEDENYILKKDLKEDKDYYLLNKDDFELLKNFFGVTNVIKRKRIDLIEIKSISQVGFSEEVLTVVCGSFYMLNELFSRDEIFSD
jgi:hypothetical protein